MKHTRSILFALMLVALGLLLFACAPTLTPSGVPPVQPAPTAGSTATPIPLIVIPGDCRLPSSGGDCHFVDTTNAATREVDVLIHVPPQVTSASLTFHGLLRNNDLLKAPIKKEWTLYRIIMGLTVTDQKENRVDHFDPAISVTVAYPDKVFAEYNKMKRDLSNVFLLLWDGVTPDDNKGAWRRLPIVKRDPDGIPTLTILIGSFLDSDDMADGG